jgi:hypothetical protein
MYEDFGTGKRAKRGLDYVAEELRDNFEFSYTMWRFDILQDAKLNLLAAPALAKADLLILSLREGQIPAETRVLIEEWLAAKAKLDCALVALFQVNASTTGSPSYAYLASLARQHGLDCFEQTVSEPKGEDAPSLRLVWVF